MLHDCAIIFKFFKSVNSQCNVQILKELIARIYANVSHNKDGPIENVKQKMSHKGTPSHGIVENWIKANAVLQLIISGLFGGIFGVWSERARFNTIQNTFHPTENAYSNWPKLVADNGHMQSPNRPRRRKINLQPPAAAWLWITLNHTLHKRSKSDYKFSLTI